MGSNPTGPALVLLNPALLEREKIDIPEQIVPIDYTMKILGVGIAGVVIDAAAEVLLPRKR